MLKIVAVFVLVMTMFNSCTKDKQLLVNNGTTTPVLLADSIFYIDIQDTVLQSFVSYYPSWGCNQPVPSDSSAKLKIDLTGDSIEDVTFTCSIAYNFVSASNPCYNYKYFINCTTDSTDGIVTLSNGMIDTLAFGKVIDSLNQYTAGFAAFKVIVPNYGFCWPINRDYYVGLKITRNGITMYGWVLVSLGTDYNSLVVKSYALNLREGNDITAGQTN